MEKQKISGALAPSLTARTGSFKLLSIFGISIHINYTWFIVVVLVAWSLASGYFPQQVPGRSSLIYWGMGFLASIVFFLCILAHEMSHSYMSKKSGIPVPRITLFVFGGVAHISREPGDPGTEFKIALAGPLMSAILWGLFFGLWVLFGTIYETSLISALFFLVFSNCLWER